MRRPALPTVARRVHGGLGVGIGKRSELRALLSQYQDLACELECRRAWAQTARQALLDDGASALVDGRVAARAKGGKKRGLSNAGAASDNDSTHAAAVSEIQTPNV